MYTAKLNAGFTLIEVLLAIAITALVAAMGYVGLTTAINALESNQRESERLEQLMLAISVVDRDMRNIVNRSIVDEFSQAKAAVSGGEFSEVLLEFTRSGSSNPLGLRRSNQQRIHYRYEDEKLWRDSWYVLDRGVEDVEPYSVLLLDELSRVELKFLKLDANATNLLGGVWLDEWPEEDANINSVPIAIELKFEQQAWGELRRVYHIFSP